MPVAAPAEPRIGAALSVLVARSVGMPGGITAGQAWESESLIDVAKLLEKLKSPVTGDCVASFVLGE